jgi:uncharacterized protein (DUF2141 family)
MEQTKIELSRLKLLCEKNEAKKQELEGKIIVAQHEVQDLQHHICVLKFKSKRHFRSRKNN